MDTPDSTKSDNTALPASESGTPSPAALASEELPRAAPKDLAVWWEVAAVVAVGVVPNLLSASVSLANPTPPSRYWLDAVQICILSGCTILVTLYLMGRSGESWARFGIVPPSLGDVTFGLLMLAAANLTWRVVVHFPDTGIRIVYPFPKPHGPGDYTLMVVKYMIASFAEELVTRAYLVTRLTLLLRSRWEAVLFAAILFASYHIYQGPAGVSFTLGFGIVYGVAFLLLGRVWPLAIGHALYNIYVELFLL